MKSTKPTFSEAIAAAILTAGILVFAIRFFGGTQDILGHHSQVIEGFNSLSLLSLLAGSLFFCSIPISVIVIKCESLSVLRKYAIGFVILMTSIILFRSYLIVSIRHAF